MATTIATKAEFSSILKHFVRTFIRRVSRDDALSTIVIRRAERAYSLQLPASLQAYYRELANAADINRCDEVLVPPGEWPVVTAESHKYLVIAHSSQEVAAYAIRLPSAADSDPPVFELFDGRARRYMASVSDYCLFFLVWQAVNGASPIRSCAYPERATLNRVRSDFQALPLKLPPAERIRFFTYGAVLAMVSRDGRRDLISFATRDSQQIWSIQKRYGLKYLRVTSPSE